MTEEMLCNIWEEFPRPQSVDRDDLLDVLDHYNIVSYNEAERDVFGDWYRAVPEDVRDDAALNMPHKVLAAEAVIFSDLKGVYRRVIRRSAEYRHLKRENWALQQEVERLRGVIARRAAWDKMMEVHDDGSNDGRAAD